MQNMQPGLEFGYNKGLPDGVKAAWGARAIIEKYSWTHSERQYSVSTLADRQDTFGSEEDRAKIREAMNSLPKPARRKVSEKGKTRWQLWLQEAKRLFEDYELSMPDDKEVVLFEDDVLIVKGNPQSSFGYLYVCAYLKE